MAHFRHKETGGKQRNFVLPWGAGSKPPGGALLYKDTEVMEGQNTAATACKATIEALSNNMGNNLNSEISTECQQYFGADPPEQM